MGRKGMKGFMKSAARPASSKPEDEEQQEAAAAAGGDQQPAPAAAAAAATPSSGTGAAKPASTPAAPAAAAGGDSDDDGQGESRSKMLQRHKKEMLAHKKAVQRMGKKSKDELAKLDAEITARHAKELQELDAAAAAAAAPGSSSAATAASAGAAAVAAGAQQAAAAADGSAAVADSASKYLKDLSVGADEEEEAGGKGGKKLSKAQKRREKMAAKDAEREARIAAELAELGPSERATEEASLAELLLPLGLGIKEIRADGHCLYRSLEDQLEQTTTAAADNGSSEQQQQQQQYNYQELRELAADYIREHKDQFAPFLLPEDESADPEDYYEQYCYTLETTAAWGGHLELTALSSALQRQIKVHAVGMDTIKLGEGEFADKPVLEICYLRHAFGLGEHYNSTKKLLFIGGADAEEEEEGGDKEQQDS